MREDGDGGVAAGGDPVGAGRPFLLPYGGIAPALAGVALAAPGAAVLGRASAGRRLTLGAGAVVRADGHYVRIGDDFRLGARGTVHIAHDRYPTHVGDGVSAEAGAVIHACEVGDDCHLGVRAIVLDGAKVPPGTAIASDALVVPRAELEGGWLYAGCPAEPVRRLSPGELEALHAGWAEGCAEPPSPDAVAAGFRFVAATAALRGGVRAEPGTGVWFGCLLDGGRHGLAVGADSNIQDNAVVRAIDGPVTIGARVTIGHNVTMTDCMVGADSLIGIGATVAPGTIVEPDVLLAAGAVTEPGQILAAGWLWAGRPAKRLRPLDDRLRAIIAGTWPRYVEYAEAFAAAQSAAGAP